MASLVGLMSRSLIGGELIRFWRPERVSETAIRLLGDIHRQLVVSDEAWHLTLRGEARRGEIFLDGRRRRGFVGVVYTGGRRGGESRTVLIEVHLQVQVRARLKTQPHVHSVLKLGFTVDVC